MHQAGGTDLQTRKDDIYNRSKDAGTDMPDDSGILRQRLLTYTVWIEL